MSEQIKNAEQQTDATEKKKKRNRNLYPKRVVSRAVSFLNNPGKNEKQRLFLEKKGFSSEQEIQKIFEYYINNTDKYKVDFLPSVSKKLIKLFLKKKFNPSEEVDKKIFEFKVSKPITYLVTESAFEKEGEMWIQQKNKILNETDDETMDSGNEKEKNKEDNVANE